jgi:hypothetical protein
MLPCYLDLVRSNWPQAGRVTDSDGGGRVRVAGRGCERSNATLSNRQFIQKHRGGTSNLQ